MLPVLGWLRRRRWLGDLLFSVGWHCGDEVQEKAYLAAEVAMKMVYQDAVLAQKKAKRTSLRMVR